MRTHVSARPEEGISSCTEPVADVADLGSAEALVGLLRAEEIPAVVEEAGLVAGLPASYRILVDPRHAYRARWVLQPSDVTEGELEFLATGKLGGESEDES